MQPRVWLEAALNGPWMRDKQPLIPLSVGEIVAEGIACAKAGAAIIHMHARDPESGRQRDDATIYAAIIEGIRAEVDAIVYPTIPLAGSPDAREETGARERFAAVEALAKHGLIEWLVVDPGSVNFTHHDDLAADREGFVYLNPEAHIRAGLALAARYGLHPSYACYEPGFVRLGAALHRHYPEVPTPIYRLMFSEGFTFGFPPTSYGLAAYRNLLATTVPKAPWMLAGLAVDVGPLVTETVKTGGHIRVGLEDAPFGSKWSNLEWVERAVHAIEEAGAALATPAEVRETLKATGDA